jgi:hypothetical protein
MEPKEGGRQVTHAITVAEFRKLAPKRRVTPEGEVLKAVKEYLTLKGWQFIRIQQSMGSTKGIPDLFAFREHAFKAYSPNLKFNCVVAIEVKAPRHAMKGGRMSPGGKLSEHQKEFRARWEREGGLFIVARSIEDLREAGL